MKSFIRKKYNNLQTKYPNANYVFQEFKKNNFFYFTKHKVSSALYFLRLIKADKKHKELSVVKTPNNSKMPLIFSTCEDKNKAILNNKKCYAIPDSQLLKRKNPNELAEELSKFDIISFDVFDTLIFRPFAKPTDITYLLECNNELINFIGYRYNAEVSARQKTLKPNFEVDIYDIYEDLSKRCYLKKEDAKKEIELEKQVCYVNPYMLEVFNLLKKKKKTIVAISDMYLPSKVIKEILEKNGFCGIDNIFVSCEHGHCKSTGELFKIAKNKLGDKKTYAHVGDNEQADVVGAKKAGFEPFFYKQCNEFGNQYRPQTLFSPVSSMYKGVVNNYLYNGTNKNSAREDFGFLYGGPIVSGYCEYVNKFVKENNLDKILFIARDMDIFYKAYNKYYKKYPNEYVTTSRFSLQECLYADFTDEILFHTLLSRCERGYTISRAFSELNLKFLLKECKNFKLNENSFILRSNLDKIHELIKANLSKVVEYFSDNETAAKMYFKQKIGNAKRVCFADLGWRGSIIAYLEYLLVHKWKLCEEVKGILLGSTRSDAAVNLISRGIITCYAYDHIHNRDFVRPDGGIEFSTVMVLESLFTSEEKSLIEYRLDKNNKVKFVTYDENPNKEIIREFQTGMMRFVDEFEKHRKAYEHIFPMSAVDAFEPMNLILKCHEYIARIIGDVLDTPYQVSGLNIELKNYVPLGNILVEKGIINKWPL